ncbi:MAG: dihydrolipoyl dehydrogenase [Dehalococcoidia bacterium]|nr:dihydrolipoyl dehydrogenase [Dehalococcoidia bacterium]
MSEYDVAVIGAGPGGYVAAIRCAQLGFKTAVIEKENLGGVCLNWGCIPSKALLKNAEILSYISRSEEFGFYFDNFRTDYKVAFDRSRKVVDRNTRGVSYLLRKNNIDHIEGSATLTGNGTIQISSSNDVIKAGNIIIATGSSPRTIPALPVDGDKVLTSKDAILASGLPKSIVIVGGGAIGVEFAYLYRMYGVEVTVVELLPNLVPNEDVEISQILERSFSKYGINVITGAGVTGLEINGETCSVALDRQGEQIEINAEKVLVAIGIQPNTSDLGLDDVGVATDRGFIQVDRYMATNVPGISAIGDVTGKMPLAHVASAQAVAVAEHLSGLDIQDIDYTYIPRATYCQPQVASFGLTEQEAVDQGFDVKIGKFNMLANGKSLAMGHTEGMVKLVVDARYGEILGGHMIGPEVTELLGELALTKLLEGTTLELGWAVHPHPTISETLKEAALSVQGNAVHM